jgi:hypothetical protein
LLVISSFIVSSFSFCNLSIPFSRCLFWKTVLTTESWKSLWLNHCTWMKSRAQSYFSDGLVDYQFLD